MVTHVPREQVPTRPLPLILICWGTLQWPYLALKTRSCCIRDSQSMCSSHEKPMDSSFFIRLSRSCPCLLVVVVLLLLLLL